MTDNFEFKITPGKQGPVLGQVNDPNTSGNSYLPATNGVAIQHLTANQTSQDFS